MDILDGQFFLAKTHFDEAVLAMKRVDQQLLGPHAFIGWNDRDDVMTRTRRRLRAWGLADGTPLEQALQQAPSVEVFLGLLDFDVSYDGGGNIDGLEWTGNYWLSYTQACLEAIAPYVEEGSYIEASLGEHGEIYRWEFTGGILVEQ